MVRLIIVETIAVSKFKAPCLSVLQRVHKTRKPVLVTRFGKPVAQIVSLAPETPKRWIGRMAGTGGIVGDIVAPVAQEGWKALKK